MQHQSPDIVTGIYNAFDPFRPLAAGDPTYVHCHDVRGDDDIFKELGNKIVRSDSPTCQLYTGHRGVGKSTELARLRQFLEERGCFVVYFAADQADIDPEDAQYSDILLACTRHILEVLQPYSEPKPLMDWLHSRWQELKALALTEVSLESLKLEAQVAQFAKLTANLRAVPNLRRQIREQVEAHTVTLLEALNEFIDQARASLPDGKTRLVVIADNLDRIVPVTKDGVHSNHDEIFLDRNEQLRALNCHVIYTVPMSMVYSNRATKLRDNYGTYQVLPMIMVRRPDGTVHQPGLAALIELIRVRVERFAPLLDLATEVFDRPETLERLCLTTGGHVREVMLLMQTAIDQIDDLPITEKAAQRAITQARNTYRDAVDAEDWERLAAVSMSKQCQNDDEYRNLLFSRCMLEYRYVDDVGEVVKWHDAHPLIQQLPEFERAVMALSEEKDGKIKKEAR